MQQKHYTTKEVLEKVQIARTTLYKWLKDRKIPEVCRDRNNFRVFTREDIDKIIRYKNMIYKPALTREMLSRAQHK